jgi:cell division protein FtsL
MNAAAKVIHQSNFFTGHLFEMNLRTLFGVRGLLIIAILISALSIVYTTNTYRVVFVELQQQKSQAHQLKLQWGQLLLEQASLANPARVQEMAEQKLGMVIPADKQTFILRTK